MELYLLAALIVVASAQGPPVGNSVPISSLTSAVCNADPSVLVADAQSLCYYYQCTPAAKGGYDLKPRRCGLGSYINSNFVSGRYNPCILRFPIMGVYDCTRKDTDNTCDTQLVCKNGATLQQEGNLCWCNCSLAYQGSPDCSVLKGTTPPAPTGLPCPDGAPLDNWCAKALPNGANPCQNGGICINQCSNFVCNCTVPAVKDKLCNQ